MIIKAKKGIPLRNAFLLNCRLQRHHSIHFYKSPSLRLPLLKIIPYQIRQSNLRPAILRHILPDEKVRGPLNLADHIVAVADHSLLINGIGSSALHHNLLNPIFLQCLLQSVPR